MFVKRAAVGALDPAQKVDVERDRKLHRQFGQASEKYFPVVLVDSEGAFPDGIKVGLGELVLADKESEER
jgi:hypothetical protein